jgi:hypothetical protein
MGGRKQLEPCDSPARASGPQSSLCTDSSDISVGRCRCAQPRSRENRWSGFTCRTRLRGCSDRSSQRRESEIARLHRSPCSRRRRDSSAGLLSRRTASAGSSSAARCAWLDLDAGGRLPERLRAECIGRNKSDRSFRAAAHCCPVHSGGGAKTGVEIQTVLVPDRGTR